MTSNNNSADARQVARRRLLRTLVAGGGAMAGSRLLPDDWRSPVVERVMLPAHAQATQLPGGDFSGNADLVGFGALPGTAPGSLLDLVVGTANAGFENGNVFPVVVSYSIGDTDGVVCISTDDDDSTGPLPLTRTGDDLSDVDYVSEVATIELREQRLTPAGVRFSISFNASPQTTYTAPPGDFVCPLVPT